METQACIIQLHDGFYFPTSLDISHITIRAVIIIDDIDVSIKKSYDIHIDTGIWISILIDIGSSKICYFLPGSLHHGGLNQTSILNDCMHQTFEAALVTVR